VVLQLQYHRPQRACTSRDIINSSRQQQLPEPLLFLKVSLSRDRRAQITFARTPTRQILQALSSVVTVTPVGLIKAMEKEAGSRGATQPKTGALDKWKDDYCSFFFIILLISLSSQSRHFHLEASLNMHIPEHELAIVFTSNILK